MSPERKVSHGYAIHIRREKQEANRQFQPIPSWETVSGMLELRTHNNPDLNMLFLAHRVIIKEFYDARYEKAVGKGDKKLKKFIRKYETNEKSKFYNPPLIDKLEPHFIIVRDSFPLSKPRR